MQSSSFTSPGRLERYSFLWSQARLVIAAFALFLGGVPPVLWIFRISALYGLISSLLTLSWVISGLASGYLLWRWTKNRSMVFGGKNQKDTVAFLVSVVSGLNLGVAGLVSTNIGMSISSSHLLFWVVGIIYLVSAKYLQRRWRAHGQRLFV